MVIVTGDFCEEWGGEDEEEGEEGEDESTRIIGVELQEMPSKVWLHASLPLHLCVPNISP